MAATVTNRVAGRFGPYGGRYVPETLVAALDELEQAYAEAQADPDFHLKLDLLLRDYAGRPTPLYFASRLTESLGGAKIYLKREDLLHTGAHKINNCLGQALLAVRMGKKRIIAETGAGQHGVATATDVYKRQSLYLNQRTIRLHPFGQRLDPILAETRAEVALSLIHI